MKNKKGIIILASVVGFCAAAYALSRIIDWPVDSDKASGNIAKSSRFSRKTEADNLSNIEELLASDPSFKNGLVAAHTVMQTRALQFGALVDMSNEVAQDIPVYATVLKDMNEAREVINNVCTSLETAGKDLNAALDGEKCPELAQNTINASLAYTTLQKQNKLADQFIDITDRYLQNNDADDRLKFVRDQWVDYQQMTAALENDIKRAEELDKKGALLTAEQSVNTLGEFKVPQQLVILYHSNLARDFGVENSLIKAIPLEVTGKLNGIINDAATAVLRDVETVPVIAFRDAITSSLSNTPGADSFLKAIKWDDLAARPKESLAALPKDNLAAQPVTVTGLLNMGTTPGISEVFQHINLHDHVESDKLGQVFEQTGNLNAIIYGIAQGETVVLHRL